jgi:hypothetical protein
MFGGMGGERDEWMYGRMAGQIEGGTGATLALCLSPPCVCIGALTSVFPLKMDLIVKSKVVPVLPLTEHHAMKAY